MTNKAITRPLLRFHGGKYRLAPKIVALMPPHRVYCEPFAGAASVLLQKPRAYSEIINDLDGEVVNLFRVLRDPKRSARLIELLKLTPFAREEYEEAYKPCRNSVEQARRLIFRSFAGHGNGAATTGIGRSGFRKTKADESHRCYPRDWADHSEALPAIVDRLRGVLIEKRDAIDLMQQLDGIDTLHYCDPPYVMATRTDTSRDMYRNDMNDADHIRLAGCLHGLEGMVMLSGYPSALYDSLYRSWEHFEFAARADGNVKRTECVWLNPAAAKAKSQGSFFDAEALAGAAA